MENHKDNNDGSSNTKHRISIVAKFIIAAIVLITCNTIKLSSTLRLNPTTTDQAIHTWIPPAKPSPKPIPKRKPTAKPVPNPTRHPTVGPTTQKPGPKPTRKLTVQPTKKPVPKPTRKPTQKPFVRATPRPSPYPTPRPIEKPRMSFIRCCSLFLNQILFCVFASFSRSKYIN